MVNTSNLPPDDNIPNNHNAFNVDLTSPWFMRKGAMIAYYGQIEFRALTTGLHARLLHMVSQQFSAPLYLGD